MVALSQQRLTAGQLWTLLRHAVDAWLEDYAPSMGAALAYYTMFSLAPLLLLAIAAAGLVFGEEAARGQLVSQLSGLVGREGGEAIQGLLKSASHTGSSIVATVISVITLLVGATSIFGELQSDLDRIWRTPAPTGPAGIWGLIRTRLLSLGMVAAIGFLLLVSLVVSAVLSAVGVWWGSWFGGWAIALQIVNQVTSFGIITVLFALMYRILPRVTVEWHDVWIGSAATALFFTIGKYLVALYIGRAAVASGFGAAGSIVVLLVWVYYSSQLFLLGAEFTWVYAQRHGSRAHEVRSDEPGPARPSQEVVDPPVSGASAPFTPQGSPKIAAVAISHVGIAPAVANRVRATPAGREFVYAGMVTAAFGLVHWYLCTRPSEAAPKAARGPRSTENG